MCNLYLYSPGYLHKDGYVYPTFQDLRLGVGSICRVDQKLVVPVHLAENESMCPPLPIVINFGTSDKWSEDFYCSAELPFDEGFLTCGHYKEEPENPPVDPDGSPIALVCPGDDGMHVHSLVRAPCLARIDQVCLVSVCLCACVGVCLC